MKIDTKRLADRADGEATRLHVYMLHRYGETVIRKNLQAELYCQITRRYSKMIPVLGGDVYNYNGKEYMKLYYERKMKKEVVWGHWYPVKEGTMPEDLLGYESYDKYDIAADVLIPCHWGNELACGNYLSCNRNRKKGGRWGWWPYPKVKPLFWMPIPKINTKFTSIVYKSIQRKK